MVIEHESGRAVIIANGPLGDPNQARRHIRAGDWLICADGGTLHALRMGLTPDVVIGDLDSLQPALKTKLETRGVRFESYPVDKDQTDLELALSLAIEEGAEIIDILAVQGGRLDQSLANLLLLTRPEWAKAQVRAVVGDEIAWPVRSGQTQAIKGAVGDRLSLIPLAASVTGVTLVGVKWPLREATLKFGSTLSISNVLTQATAHLQIREGLLLVIHETSSVEQA